MKTPMKILLEMACSLTTVRLKFLLLVAGYFFLTLPQDVFGQPRFGLWVEVEGEVKPFVSQKSWAKFQAFVEEGRFTDLYCQVYRSGRSWFPSLLADATPFYESMAKNLDPLAETLRYAHARKKKVHAWVNVLRLAHDVNAPLLQIVGSDAVLVDNYGNSLLAYGTNGSLKMVSGKNLTIDTPGIWLNPQSKRVREYVVETLRDLIIAYPELDGIHLDMIRYPFGINGDGGSPVSLGYSHASVLEYHAASDDSAERLNPTPDLSSRVPVGSAWKEWQRAQVTLLVMEIRELINSLAPHIELSVAAIASPDRAYHHAYQDWGAWLRGGIIDWAIPMNYNTDVSAGNNISVQAMSYAENKRALMGLGAWLFLNQPEQLGKQVQYSLQSGARGVVLFSYSNLENAKGRTLVKGVAEKVAAFSSVFPPVSP